MAWDLALLHLLAALAPALGLALLLPFFAALIWRKKSLTAHVLLAQAALVFIASTAAQLFAWWVWGSATRMAAYAVLVLAAGSAQAWSLRGRR